MKNKLVVMFLTFVILILITPFIFSKLMNAKYNQMLDNLRNEGINIKILKDKSSYITSDKVLEVTIPDKILKTNGIIENVTLNVETQFKNLPVTNVLFIGNVKNINLSQQYQNIQKDINQFAKKYIKFVVTTPNFRDYSYKFDDIKVNKTPQIVVLGISGLLKKSDILKNKILITDMYLKDKKALIEIKNFKNSFEGNEKNYFTKTNFNVDIDLNRLKVQIDNVFSKTKTLIDQKTKIDTEIGFDQLDIVNMLNVKKFDLNLKLDNLDTKTIMNLSKLNKNEREKELTQIFEKGFNVGLNTDLKNITFQKQKLGGLHLKFSAKILPTNNIQEKLQNNDFSFVNAKLNLKTTPEIANIVMNLYPQSAFLFALAKKTNGEVILDLEFKNGKLYSEGQLVK